MALTRLDAVPGNSGGGPRPSTLTRVVPWLVMATGLGHTVTGLIVIPITVDPNPFTGVVRDGFFDTIDGHYERSAALWFLLAGLFLIALGHLLRWTVRRTGRIPALAGWWLLVFAVPILVVMPTSGGWLLVIDGTLAVLAARSAEPGGVSD